MRTTLTLLLLVSLLGCERRASGADSASSPSASSTTTPSAVYRIVSHAATEWITFDLDLATVSLRLVGQAPGDPTTLPALGPFLSAQGRAFVVATNAGIFSPERRPMGLCIQDGKELAPLSKSDGEGNFFLKPNGVFWLDVRGAHVASTEAYAPEGRVELATQSGPLLLEKGHIHPSFRESSDSLRTRSGVGVDARGHVMFALSRARVSFYSTATLFRDVLGCPDALYLDGEISDVLSPGLAPTKKHEYGGMLVAQSIRPLP